MAVSICTGYPIFKKYANAHNMNVLHNMAMQVDAPERDTDEIVTWINQIAVHFQITIAGLASRAHVSQSVLSRIVRGETTKPTIDTLTKLAAYSPIAIPLSVQKQLDRRPLTAREQVVNNWAGSPDEEGIPVWGVHPIRRDAEFYMNPVPISFISRGRVGTTNHKLAAFYAPDETMSPRWRAGEPVIFDKSRSASSSEFALIRLTSPTDENGDEVFLFREIVGRRNKALHYRSLEDETVKNVPLTRLIEIRRVLNWSDLLS